MFIDYVTVMLLAAVAGLASLACFVWRGIDSESRSEYAPAFAVPGLILVLTGLHMVYFWPLPGAYNSAFGESSIMFGTLLFGAAYSLKKGLKLNPLAIPAFIFGLAALVIGVRFIKLDLTMKPLLSGLGFITAGIAGIFAWLPIWKPGRKDYRLIGAIILLVSALIWAMTGFVGIWMHMDSFRQWSPNISQ